MGPTWLCKFSKIYIQCTFVYTSISSLFTINLITIYINSSDSTASKPASLQIVTQAGHHSNGAEISHEPAGERQPHAAPECHPTHLAPLHQLPPHQLTHEEMVVHVQYDRTPRLAQLRIRQVRHNLVLLARTSKS